MSEDWRPGTAEVKAAEARAHTADENAETWALLIAEAVLDETEVGLLRHGYRRAKAEATYAWAVFDEATARLAGEGQQAGGSS